MGFESQELDIFCLRAEGFSISSISKQLCLDEVEVREILSRKPVLRRSVKRSKIHKLSKKDQQKGGEASQRTRAKQRKENFERVSSLIDVDSKFVELACVFFMQNKSPQRCLWKNEDFKKVKEFSIVIHNEDVGFLFLKALERCGVPKEAITFMWGKSYQTYFGVDAVKKQWGKLADYLQFPKHGSKEVLTLKVSAFKVGLVNVSGRALAQAFFQAGRDVLKNAAK
jgi:hypothetical protein